MNICIHNVRLFLIISITLLTLAAQSAMAKEMPIVDGALWTKSTTLGKHSYLIGVSNLLEVEYAYQKRNGRQPSDDQSIIRRLFENTAELTLDQMMRRIDRWYQRNPDQLSKAVIDVIWVDMVLAK